MSLFLSRQRPALLAAGFGVSRLPPCSLLLLWNDGVLKEAALWLETPVAVPREPEMVGADEPSLGLGGVAGDGVDLPEIVPRR